jgi:hypothetical protein
LLDAKRSKDWRLWLLGLPAVVLPLLLYAYIPLRSGPESSPWYHPRLGAETLRLYPGGWQGFVDFVSGRSISAGFYDMPRALTNLGQAWLLWRLHFGWAGLLLVLLGLFGLVRQRNWRVLVLTAPLLALQQAFNLFYAIGDILVYYIPIYLAATVWAAYGVAQIAQAGAQLGVDAPKTTGKDQPQVRFTLGMLAIPLLLLLPIQSYREYQPRLDQAQSVGARQRWEAILAADPPTNAILVSNDRNEIVPLYYLQAVENRRRDLGGLFPLLTPAARFADIGAVIDASLASGQPVYLIKEMRGLEVKFALEAAAPPLLRVLGPAVNERPSIAVNQRLGALTLLGYDWRRRSEQLQIDLYWQVEDALDADYTSTVQVFDDQGVKLGQEDHRPGGNFYPTSLWKPGERLRDRHLLSLAGQAAVPHKLLIGMYVGAEFRQLAPPLEIVIVDE